MNNQKAQLSDAEKTQRAEALARIGWRLLLGPSVFAMFGNLLDVNLWASAAAGAVVSITLVVLSSAIQGQQPARNM